MPIWPPRTLVPLAGIEPALLAELDFESSASTNSATGAFPDIANEREVGKPAEYSGRGGAVNPKLLGKWGAGRPIVPCCLRLLRAGRQRRSIRGVGPAASRCHLPAKHCPVMAAASTAPQLHATTLSASGDDRDLRHPCKS